MIDPGALGTLIIGLDHVRREQEYSEPSRRRSLRTNKDRRVSRTAAIWLRSLADAIEPRTTPQDLAMES